MKKLFLVLILTGCATISGYDGMIKSYHGATEAELVRVWGAPTQIHQVEGKRFLTYFSSSISSSPTIAPTYSTSIVGNTVQSIPFGGSPGRIRSRSCRTTFEIEKNRVVYSTFEGNNCRGWSKDKFK